MEVLKSETPRPAGRFGATRRSGRFCCRRSPVYQSGSWVLAPSCDRVGRNFPFLVTTAILDKNAMSLLPRAAPIALAWAHVVADAQSARMNIDAVDTALSSALVAELDKSRRLPMAKSPCRPVRARCRCRGRALPTALTCRGRRAFGGACRRRRPASRARTHSGALTATHFVGLCG